jgi:hypothetical protein
MTKLSDTQAVILSAASQRDDGAVLPFPETLRIKGGAVAKVLGSLKTKGLIDHQGTPRGDNPPPLRITRAGLQAIGVETQDDASEGAAPADTGATSTDAGPQASDAAAPVTKADGAATPAKRKAKARAAKPGKAASAERSTPRAGTKQALMIDLLKRPEGATVEPDRRGDRVAAPHHPGRHLRRAQEEARPHGRSHPHPRGRAQQDWRQGQRDHLPDRSVACPTTRQRLRRRGPPPGGDLFAALSSRWRRMRA